MAAGREIEQALGLAPHADLLAKWMVYRLAEVRAAVANAPTAAEKKQAAAEQDKLIMALWEHRNALPNPVGIEGRLAPALAILEAALSDPPPWHEQADDGSLENLVRRGVVALRHVALHAAILERKRRAVALGEVDADLPSSGAELELEIKFGELETIVIRSLRASSGTWSAEPLSPREEMELLAGELQSDVVKLRTIVEDMARALAPEGKSPRVAATHRLRKRQSGAKRTGSSRKRPG